MDMKKIFLFALLLSMAGIFQANATTYLNSCGAVTSASDETYIINFTTIPNTYGGSSCLTFSAGAYSNMTITAENRTITNEETSLANFIVMSESTSGVAKDEITIKDINIISDVADITFLYISNTANALKYYDNFDIYNIYANNLNRFIHVREGVGGVSRHIRFRYGDFDDISVDNIEDVFFYFSGYSASSSRAMIEESTFNDVYFLADSGLLSATAGNSVGWLQNNDFYNCMFFASDVDTGGSANNNDVSYSLFWDRLHNDTDNNNIADSDVYTDMTNMRIYVEIDGINFIQDFDEGEGDGSYNFVTDNTLNVVYINDETLDQFYTTMGSGRNDFSYSNPVLADDNAIAVNGHIDCSLFNDDKCYFSDTGYTGNPAGDEYRPMIRLGSNTLINYVSFSHSDSNNAHRFSQSSDSQLTNITYTNNALIKMDGVLTGGDTSSNELIKHRMTYLDMHDNRFTMQTSDRAYELISIESTAPTTNKITLNIFNNTITTPTNKSVIFNSYCDTLFYNNYISNNTLVEDAGCVGDLDTSPYIAYLHTDDKVYYFNIGNYYEENTGCTDGNADGICDSPYVSGSNTDNYPLVSYPYVYTSHLGDAVEVIDALDFNVTLVTPTDNETIVIDGVTSTISLSFFHESEFSDLDCSYIVDGITEDSIYGLLNDTIDTSLLSGWTEKLYTFKVSCLNEFISSESDEISFTVEYGEEEPPDTGGIFTNFTGTDFINVDDIDATTDNIGGFMGNTSAFLMNVGVPLVIIICIIGALIAIITIIS